ncbi:MAG: 4Fe-4S binding protein [Coprobacillus sp.]|nr:4Fe-4S binding protein [Coprobacillus sp.]
MQKVKLGRTNIVVNKNGFGALPVQRVSFKEAQIILRKAYENGICFFDSARAYSDSEEKIGKYLSGVRKDIYIATKTMASTVEEFWKDLQTSLEMLKTDYIDIYQFHNPSFCPKPEDGSGLYEAMLEAKKQGKIRYIGLTNHKIHIAKEAAESGLYDTIQFPFSYLASSQDLELVKICERNHVGFICMKALSGGLIHRSDIAYAYLSQFDNVLPIWGIQKESELDEFLSYQDNPPILTKEIEQIIQDDRKELAGNFCRGCGYCMPCPQGIVINQCARMSLMLRRAPTGGWLSEKWQQEMKKIEDCIHCGKCMQHCPYGLNTPELLKMNYEDYKTFLE